MSGPHNGNPTEPASGAGVGRDDTAFLRLLFRLPAGTRDGDVLAYAEAAREEHEAGRAADDASARLAALSRALHPNGAAAFPAPVRLDPAALYGLPGRIVAALRPTTEACDAAVLVHALAAASCVVGPGPYVAVGSTRHPARVSPLVVGTTGHGRKGTALDSALAPFVHRDGPGLPRRVQNVQSGEAIIEAVRDGQGEEAGVEDKRLLCLETEFGNVLAAKGRTGSTLTGVIRQAWDSGDLFNTKIRAVQATGAHVVFCGHVTPAELHDAAGRTDVANGFLNRFLFAHAQAVRSIPLPEPPPDAVLAPLAAELRQAVAAASGRGRVELSPAAAELWRRLYPHLDADAEGAVGALLARTKPYLLRIALVYSLLDGAERIGPAHLRAACAVWDYHAATVRRLYQGRTGNALDGRVLDALRDAGGEASRTDLTRALSGHVRAAELDAARDRLTAAGSVEVESVETPGRPREVWRTSEGSEGSRVPTLVSLSSHFARGIGDVPDPWAVGARVELDGGRVGTVTAGPEGGHLSVEAGGLPFRVPVEAVRPAGADR